MKRRTLIIAALATAALTVCLLVYLRIRPGSSRVTAVSTGPLDIRLWGIRPDAGGVIYDPNGKEISKTLGIVRWDSSGWYVRRHDFIFELSEAEEPLLFSPHGDIFVSAENVRLGRELSYKIYRHRGKNLLWLKTTLPRTFRKSMFFGRWIRNIPFDAIDLTLRYYQGPPREPLCSFKGPFKIGQKLTDETGRYEITFKPHPDSSDRGHVLLELNTKQRLSSNVHVMLYDTAGDCRFIRDADVSIDADSRAPVKCRIYELSCVAMLTFDEKPFERTFKNIRLDLPPSKPRTYLDYLDKMAETLSLDLEPQKLMAYDFKNGDEAIKVLDIVRGPYILRATRAIWSSSTDEGRLKESTLTLTTEQIGKLRSTAMRWTEAMDPDIRIRGVSTGLRYKWPEFVEPAFKLVEYRRPYNRDSVEMASFSAAASLGGYRDQLSDAQIDRIRQILLHQVDFGVIMHLKGCLQQPKSPGRVEALWSLANEDHPGLWWFAVKKLADWGEFKGKEDSLPHKLKVRLRLCRGPRGFSNPDQLTAEILDLRPKLLTPEVLALGSSVFYSTLGTIAKNPAHEYATTAMIRFLRSIEDYNDSVTSAVGMIVRYINLWHNLNIGKLGTNARESIRRRYMYDWRAITAETIKWYETRNTPDPNSSALQKDR